jgi:hypothetical protein
MGYISNSHTQNKISQQTNEIVNNIKYAETDYTVTYIPIVRQQLGKHVAAVNTPQQ